MKEILFDLLIFWVAMIVGVFGWYINAPVLIFVAVVFVVTSIVWMAMDIYELVRRG